MPLRVRLQDPLIDGHVVQILVEIQDQVFVHGVVAAGGIIPLKAHDDVAEIIAGHHQAELLPGGDHVVLHKGQIHAGPFLGVFQAVVVVVAADAGGCAEVGGTPVGERFTSVGDGQLHGAVDLAGVDGRCGDLTGNRRLCGFLRPPGGFFRLRTRFQSGRRRLRFRFGCFFAVSAGRFGRGGILGCCCGTAALTHSGAAGGAPASGRHGTQQTQDKQYGNPSFHVLSSFPDSIVVHHGQKELHFSIIVL